MKNIPTHIAIIPDGNRRWAKKRGLPAWKGHFEGAKAIEKVAKEAYKLDIKYLTVWCGSYDNLTKRPKVEIDALNKVYYEIARKALKDKDTDNVKVRVIGEYKNLLTPKTIDILDKLERETRKNKKANLTLLIGYNGDREMLSAIKKLTRFGKPVSDENIKKALWTGELPAVDLVIRTGGDPHLSAGFMMWHVRYSALHFSDKLWPEFKPANLKKTLSAFASQERRKGK